MSQKKSEYPKTYKHPVTEQERVASNVAQEVGLKYDGYRVVEGEPDAGTPSAEADKTETPKTTSTPKPSAPKAQETK